jgi:hypothetical protein
VLVSQREAHVEVFTREVADPTVFYRGVAFTAE